MHAPMEFSEDPEAICSEHATSCLNERHHDTRQSLCNIIFSCSTVFNLRNHLQKHVLPIHYSPPTPNAL
jgi:hypothetical protein